jgi:hypothetical protein
VLRVRPLDTLFTSFDEPFWVDIESDRITDVEVYIGGATTPYTTLTVGTTITRVRVWDTNPIASTPTNQIHRITFKSLATNEIAEVYIAYFRTGLERLEFRPARGLNLMGYVTQLMIIGDRVFTRRIGVRRIAPILAPDDRRVFHEFTGYNELGDKFYYVIRQDRLMLLYAGQTDAVITLNPVTSIPVTVDYWIQDLPLLALFQYLGKAAELMSSFMKWAGRPTGLIDYTSRFRVGVARFISKALGIQQEIVNVEVVGDRLRVTYLVDAPPLAAIAVYGLVITAGAYVLQRLITTIRDIVVEREQTIQTIQILESIRAVNEERTRAINAALEYAREQGLTPQETLALVEAVGEQYNTSDIVKATQALQEIDKLKSEIESLKTQRYAWAIGGAGVGALITALAKR